MEIPLENRLKRRLHVDIGRLQDEVVGIAYAIEGRAVLHGGTAIWRCFSGNRFSEDIDIYAPRASKLAEKLGGVLESRGLALAKMKMTENLLFAKITDGNAEVRLEANLTGAKIKPEARRYSMMNGGQMDVFCPSLPELMNEKIRAYQSRRFVRDLYDIYHLAHQLGDDSRKVAPNLRAFLDGFKKPADEANLPALVYFGAVPSIDQMLLSLRRRFQ
jgi:predicted nucleotidyltransferase component of viral defense system